MSQLDFRAHLIVVLCARIFIYPITHAMPIHNN